MVTLLGQQKLAQLEAPVRRCETCNAVLAVEWRGYDEAPEEVIYFCVNKEQDCPQFHQAQ